MIIETDTEKMLKDGNELNKLVTKYNKTIQAFKLRMKSFDGWQGDDADAYKDGVLKNIMIFEDVGSSLGEYANFLISYSNKIEAMAKDLAIDEKEC